MNNILRIIVGLIFIFSGLVKLYPIEPFELVFVDLGVSNWLYAPFIARFVIVFEMFLGLSIIFNVWLKNLIYNLAQGALIFFTFYLIFLLITQGNNVDCGCFGSLLALTPVESIIKNILLIGMLLFIKRRYYSRGLWWLSILFIVIASVSTFSLNRVGLHNLQGVAVNEKINFTSLPTQYKTNQQIDFSKGKKMVVFFTWTCPHCINAARKFVSLDKKKPINNLYLIVGSKREKGLLDFIEKTGVDFPIIWMENDDFFKYSGGRLPAIVYIEDGIIKKKWFGDLFDVDEVQQYLE